MTARIISVEALERARCAKYGIPYDPEMTKFIRGWVAWKCENHRLMQLNQPAPARRNRTRDKEPLRALSPSRPSPDAAHNGLPPLHC